MLEYTAYDVLHLPTIYTKFRLDCDTNYNFFQKILNECKKYLEYANINLNIKNYNKINLQKDKEVQGLIKYN
jgi:hypothetical protein